MVRSISVVVFASLLFAGVSLAQEKDARSDTNNAAIPKPLLVTTQHTITIEGKQIHYTATTGTILLRNQDNEPIALFGFTAYTKDGVTDPSTRPITFAYNGGPGSSSLWLHMGALGPKKVVLDDAHATPPAPYKLEDNTHSILDVTDLVIIDAIGTGFSKPVGKSKGSEFWGIDEDAKATSEFIFQYLSDYDRLNSPKFLFGESYGTTRNAAVGDYLYENDGIQLNGIIFLSTVWNFETLSFAPGNDLPYILYMPTYAAVAWYHNALPSKPADLPAFMKKVRDFAKGEYADALFKGQSIDSTEYNDVLDKLHEYTGISKSYWAKADLRLSEPQFTAELLRDRGETVGRLDARFTGPEEDMIGEYARYDPQSVKISPPFITEFLNYLHNDLKYPTKYYYRVDAYGMKGFKWDWNQEGRRSFGFRDPNVAPNLGDLMSKDPYMKILMLNGYFDLATPFFATEYSVDHLGNNIPNLMNRVEYRYYEAGHMVYVNPNVMPQLHKDVADFIESMIRPGK